MTSADQIPAIEHFYVPGGPGRWGCGCGAKGRVSQAAGNVASAFDAHIQKVLRAARASAAAQQPTDPLHAPFAATAEMP